MIFKNNVVDFDKSVIMNWRVGKNDHQSIQLGTIGEGYLLASKNIIESFDPKEKNGDVLIFPALFNLMHGIEVYLKAMIINLQYINYGKWGNPEKIHKLNEIYGTVEKLIVQHEKDALKEIEPVKIVITEITKKTTNMDFARYPQTIKSKPQFYVESTENIVVDADELKKAVIVCRDVLDRMNWYFYEQARYLDESHSNM